MFGRYIELDGAQVFVFGSPNDTEEQWESRAKSVIEILEKNKKGGNMYSCNTCKGQHNVGEICPKPIHFKQKGFEDWLMDYYAENDGRAVLDDCMPDAFNDWLCDLDVDEWIKLGDKYAESVKLSY